MKIEAVAIQQLNEAKDGFQYMPMLYVDDKATGISGETVYQDEQTALNVAQKYADKLDKKYNS